MSPILKDFLRQFKIHIDNKSAICLVKNHADSKRSRHVSLRNHYCREQHEKGRIIVKYIETAKQEADALTKAGKTNQLL